METVRSDGADDDLVANLAWVRRLVLAIVRDDALADDVAQDVAFQALRRPPDERPSSLAALRAWLATSARRMAIDRARAERSRRAREQAVARPEAERGSADAVERGARSRRVVEAVMQLAEPYRSAILLRYMDQLPMAEVARRLSVSEATVRKRLSAGLALLRSQLDDELGEDSRTWAVAILGLHGREAAALPAPALELTAIVHGALLMNAKWVAAGVGVVIVGFAAWFAMPDPDAMPAALTGGPRGDAELIGLSSTPAEDARRALGDGVHHDAPGVDAASVVGPSVIVRSSIGLPLPFVDVQDERGDWRRAALEQDRCALDPAIPLPRLLRAPGHVPAPVTRLGETLTLEPDALLTLEAQDLRTRTRSIRVEDRFSIGERPMAPEMRQAVAFGFLSDDTWCVAVSHDLVQDAVFEDDLDVEILWPDHQRADVHFRAVPGARGRWTVPVDRGSPGSPLRLHVRRPPDEPAGDVLFRVTVPREGGPDATSERFVWGSAVVYEPLNLWMDEQRLAAGSSVYTFDFLPTGVPLVLGAHDPSSCAYGRLSFVHDGSDRTLELRSAFVLRGCLLSAGDRAPVSSANFTWEFRDERYTEYCWRCEKFPLATDPSGCFEARGPMQMTLSAAMDLDRPSRLAIEVKAPGFEDFQRVVETGGARTFDCGDLLLTRRAAQIVLAPGHDVPAKAIAWQQLRISTSPELFWDIRGGALNPDGSLSVYVEDAEDSTQERRRFAASRRSTREDFGLPWPTHPGRWLMIHMLVDDHDETWLFERQDSASYVAVPRREVVLDVKCGAAPVEGENWKLGWQVHDQWGSLGVGVPSVVGELNRIRFSVPAGAQLWWSSRYSPPGVQGAPANVGGFVSIDALRGRIELR